jgi:WD40 repeat protein
MHLISSMQINIISTNKFTGHKGAIYKLLPIISTNSFLSAGGDGWIVKWHPESSPDGILKAQDTDVIFCLSQFSTSGIIAGTFQGNFLVFKDLEDPQSFRKIEAHKKGVFDILIYENHLISCGGDGRVTLWDIEKMLPIQSIQVSSGSVRSMSMDLTNSLLYAGTSDGSIVVIDFQSFELSRTIRDAHERSVFKVCSLPNGAGFLSGGMDARLKRWHAGADSAEIDLPAHWFTVNDIALHPEGKIVASASRDKKIRVWQLEDMKLLKEIDGHMNSVNTLFWDANGNMLYSGSDDRTIQAVDIKILE